MALFNHLDAAVFADAGNVAPHVADVNLDKRSYGAGLRLLSRIHVRPRRHRARRRGMAVHAPVERSAAAQTAHPPHGAGAVRSLSWRRVNAPPALTRAAGDDGPALSFCAAANPSDDVSARRAAGQPVVTPPT